MSLTVKQAAERLNVSERTIRREISDGKLPIVRIRGCVRITPAALERYQEEMQCRSAGMAKDGKSAFSIPGSDLAELLGICDTRKNTKPDSGAGSQIVELAARRNTRSQKPSQNGSKAKPRRCVVTQI